jgi:hypothetical protein
MFMALPDARVLLEFDEGELTVGDDVDIRTGLSGVALSGDDLWLACDEGCRIDRLSRSGSRATFSSHAAFPLEGLFTLPDRATEEADIEGLDVDEGWLWLVGSHSVKRKKAAADGKPADVAKALAKTGRDGNRHLLARVPLDGNVPARRVGSRRAGSIAATRKSSRLLKAIVEDEHLAPFVEIPGKDNGFDIEGLAVRDRRAFIGLRGPVLREWCCILEVRIESDNDGSLRLTRIDEERVYRKHFLKLAGLGVRDLVWLGNDLLILAGPTMALDGAHEIWRWKNAAKAAASGGARSVQRLLALPASQGSDRAEGMTLFEKGNRTSVLVVFDTPGKERLVGRRSVRADVFRLP